MIALGLMLGACGWFPYHAGPDVYDGSENVFYYDLDDVNPDRTVRYSLDVGSAPRDVYLVFTNPTVSEISTPAVEARSVLGPIEAPEPRYSSPGARSLAAAELASGPVALRDNPEIADWVPPTPGATSRSLAPSEPSFAAVPGPDKYDAFPESGEYGTYSDDPATTFDFYYDSTSSPIESVLATRMEGVTTANGPKTLEIWVEAAEWYDSTEDFNDIRSEWTDALADSFLQAGADNDIYDWVSSAFGEEWSPEAAAYSNTIDGHDTITILLYNIGNDGPAGIVGFFWAKDNFIRTEDNHHSNERIMFYIDSETFKEPDGSVATWSIDNYWPSDIVSTLGHELQHMIHFHERAVLRSASTPTWMNEVMSLAAEDLVEEKRSMIGPRGVDPVVYDTGSAGGAGINRGRLPLYNVANDISLTAWDTSGDVLESYAIAYSFAAFLGRNYGGARLFSEMSRNSSSSMNTMLSASIAASGGPWGMTLEQLLLRWGAAAILSDTTGEPAGTRFNTGEWISSDADGLTYRLGSINLYNYVDLPHYETGTIYTTDMPAGSKLLYKVGSDLTGEVELSIDFDEGMDFAVVVK